MSEKKSNPNYLTEDKVSKIKESKILNSVFDVPVLLRKIEYAQTQLLFSFDEFYSRDAEQATYNVDSFDETDMGRMGVELRPSDEFYYEEVQEKADHIVDVLQKNYPTKFTSPYGYYITWDEGRFVFQVTLDEEGRNELIEKYGIDMSVFKKKNPKKKKSSKKKMSNLSGVIGWATDTVVNIHREDDHDEIDAFRVEDLGLEDIDWKKYKGHKVQYSINDKTDSAFNVVAVNLDSIKKSNPDYLAKKFDLLDRVKALVDNGFNVYSDDYRTSFKEDELARALLIPKAFITSDLFRYSDYGGGYTIAKANIRYIEDNYKDLIDKELISTDSTAYNGENMEFKFAALADDKLYEELLSLEGYPVLDDQTLSEVEMELEDECWNSYGRDMFKDALIEKYGEEAEELSDEEIDDLAYEASQYTCCGRGEVENMEFSFDIKGMIEALSKVEKGVKLKVKKENPVPKCENPSWAKDEEIWDKARKQSLKSYGKISYPFVVYLYKQMGGKIKKKK